MKQKLLIFAFSVMALALGFDFISTANPIEGLLAVGAVTSAMAQASPVGLSPSWLFCLSLTTVKRSPCNKTNPGGNKKWLAASCEDFTRAWPEESDVDANGYLTGTIPLKPGKAFAEIEFTANTAKADYAKEGDEGHQSYKHMAESKVSGYASDQWLALRKYLNMRFVLIAKHGDNQMVVYAHSEDGFSMKETHTTGLKGSDKREFTLKMEVDGLNLAPPILGPTVNVPVLV